MGSLTDGAETRVANWLTADSTTAPTAPMKCRLMTANGSDSAAGTEVAGGTYAPQTISFTTSGSVAANDAIVRFEGIANPRTLTGFEVWDSNGTPFRWAWAAFTGGNKTVTDGIVEFAIGELTITVD